jgi:hypothetical protein
VRTTFIITSAINPGVGLFSPEQRINQTIQTISSIKNVFPESNLILVDGGKYFREDLKNFLMLKNNINLYLNMHENIQIKNLHNNFFPKIKNKYELGGNAGGLKTLSEICLMKEVFFLLKNNKNLLNFINVDAIFKISGRYVLSSKFNKQVYHDALVENNFVFRAPEKSYLEKINKDFGIDKNISTALYGFNINLFDEMIKKFEDILNDFLKINKTHYIDLEHLFFKHFRNHKHTIFLNLINVFGRLGSSGTFIYK